jgi:hypothetical protein
MTTSNPRLVLLFYLFIYDLLINNIDCAASHGRIISGTRQEFNRRTEEYHRNLQSGLQVSVLRFEVRTSEYKAYVLDCNFQGFCYYQAINFILFNVSPG